MPMAEAPSIGSLVVIDGVELRRIPSVIQQTAMPSEAFEAISRPDWWPYAPRHTESGRPIFHNRREAKDAAAFARDSGEDIHYDA